MSEADLPACNVDPVRVPPTALERAFRAAWAAAGGGALLSRHGAIACFFRLEDWEAWRGGAPDLLSHAEHARCLAKHKPRERRDLVLAYALHRLVLGAGLGLPPARVPLQRDALGRPCLPGAALHTSLAHADGMVAVAAARHGAIGVDVEARARAADMLSIADAVCTPAEAAALPAWPGDARGMALLAAWVRKEAVLKAAGIGLVREPNGFAAAADAWVPLPRADGGDGPERARVLHVDAGDDWLAAVATVAGDPVPALRLLPAACPDDTVDGVFSEGSPTAGTPMDNALEQRMSTQLATIEARLCAQAPVAEAVVAVRGEALVAYVVAASGAVALEATLAEALAQQLPPYLRPRQYVWLASLPRAADGSVDRAALPAPDAADQPQPAEAPPQADSSAARIAYLGALWSQLLDCEVAPGDNFFDLGGHSMLAVQMARRVQQDTGARIQIMTLATQTLAQIAAELPPPRAAAGRPGEGVGSRLANGLRGLFGGVRSAGTA